MIKPLQIHTSFAFEVRRYEDGPSISLSLGVTTNGVNEDGKELTIDETLAIHIHTMKDLQEGKLQETLEQRGIKILMAQAEYSEPDVVPSLTKGGTDGP